MVVIDNIIFTLQRFGGISNLFSELILRLLNNRELDVRVFENYADEQNIFRERLPISNNYFIRHSPRILERYRDVKLGLENKYIFHSSYYRVSKDKNAVNVTTVHDFSYEKYVKNPLVRLIHHCQKRHAVRHSDAIICVSENTKIDLMYFFPFVDPAKVSVIYNGAADAFYPLGNKDKEMGDTILFIGGRDRYKNADFVVKSLSDTKYHILFCGKALSKKEHKYYESILGSDRYTVKSNVSIEQLNYYLNNVKCLIYPSSYEGFGIPIVEAQKAGCPVIALNSSSIPEVIGDTPLLMKTLSKEDLLSKLTILDDEKVREMIITKGFENSKRFSWDETYRRYSDLYKSLL